MRLIKYFFLNLFFCFFLISPVLANDSDEIKLKVKLDNNLNKVEFKIVEGDYSIIDLSTGMILASPQKDEKWIVTKKGFNLILHNSDLDEDLIMADSIILSAENEDENNVFDYKNKKYQDNLILLNENEGILAVNNIDVENYLYGVIGKEMGASAHIEALKAQAIVSRTYALYKRGNNIKYDLTSDTLNQVYDGYDQLNSYGKEKIKEAVDDTKGLVIYYNDKIIEALFHSNAGGYTEDSENVWGSRIPYLRAVPSPDDICALEYEYQTSSGWPANNYQWEKIFTYVDIENLIERWNQSRNDKIDIGNISNIKISRKSYDGKESTRRVTSLELIGTKGNKILIRDSIRSFLQLRSTLFDIEFDNNNTHVFILDNKGQAESINDWENLKAIKSEYEINDIEGHFVVFSNGKKELKDGFETIRIIGKGYGHGVGMSQWGARGMSKNGADFEEIIYHYYGQNTEEGNLEIKKYH